MRRLGCGSIAVADVSIYAVSTVQALVEPVLAVGSVSAIRT